MASSDNKTGELSFLPRARIIRTIGDRLISGPEAAVIELVKNAHDADASFARVIFQPPLTSGKGSIVIEDDGHGMSLEVIQDHWMQPATTEKVERQKSPGGRRLLGSKGIGRFATARLGRFLELATTAKPSDSRRLRTTRLPDIDWDEFDQTRYLADVSVNYENFNARKGKTGTKLIVTDLRDRWTKDSLHGLLTELRRLISPLDSQENAEFKIYLDLSACTEKSAGFDGSNLVNGQFSDTSDGDLHRVRPIPLLSACDYEVEGVFDVFGKFHGEMTVHRGAQEPRMVEANYPLRHEELEQECGEVQVRLFIFDREGEALEQTMRKAGLEVGRRESIRILNEVCGVAIYRNSFRIRPYGDNDQDWLTLDSRRVQNPTLRIGSNQIVGLITIQDESESNLEERSSREGLEDNGAYRRLVRMITGLLADTVEPRRYDFRIKARISRHVRDPLQSARSAAQMEWTSSLIQNLPEDLQDEVEQQVAAETEKLQILLEEVEENQARLQARVADRWIDWVWPWSPEGYRDRPRVDQGQSIEVLNP